jgi:hypothetical protein
MSMAMVFTAMHLSCTDMGSFATPTGLQKAADEGTPWEWTLSSVA